MQATLTFSGITVYSYGLTITMAAILLLALMGIIGHFCSLPAGTVRVFGIVAIVLGLTSSRLMFCLFNLPLFIETYENPWLMLRFFDGGLSMAGFIIGLLLAAWLTARWMQIPFGKLLDVMTLPLGLFIAVCRIAESFTDLGVGKVVEESWITQRFPWLFLTEQAGVATEYRMAVYGYEAVAGLLLFVLMLVLFHLAQKQQRFSPGDRSLLFFALYGAIQMLLESMRDDGHMLIIFLRISQVFAALLPLSVTAIFTRRYVRVFGRASLRIYLSWTLLLICVAVGVALEFSLDGRLSFGTPSLLRDYSIMAVLCALLFAVPCSLFRALSNPSPNDRQTTQ